MDKRLTDMNPRVRLSAARQLRYAPYSDWTDEEKARFEDIEHRAERQIEADARNGIQWPMDTNYYDS